jgi:hypothetical protein
LPGLVEPVRQKRLRHQRMSERALLDLEKVWEPLEASCLKQAAHS